MHSEYSILAVCTRASWDFMKHSSLCFKKKPNREHYEVNTEQFDLELKVRGDGTFAFRASAPAEVHRGGFGTRSAG